MEMGPAIDGHGQLRVGMPRLLHGLLERRSALIEEGDEGMAGSVEVGV